MQGQLQLSLPNVTHTADFIFLETNYQWVNYLPQLWVELVHGCLLTDSSATKVIGTTEILRRIWLFYANAIKSSESFSK